jgi:hypothetical protein
MGENENPWILLGQRGSSSGRFRKAQSATVRMAIEMATTAFDRFIEILWALPA